MERPFRRLALLRITSAQLADILKLPADAKIVGVSADVFFSTDDICFKVESPFFNELCHGEPLPTRHPAYDRDENGEDVFAGWK